MPYSLLCNLLGTFITEFFPFSRWCNGVQTKRHTHTHIYIFKSGNVRKAKIRSKSADPENPGAGFSFLDRYTSDDVKVEDCEVFRETGECDEQEIVREERSDAAGFCDDCAAAENGE